MLDSEVFWRLVRCKAHGSRLALVSLIAALGSLAACVPRGHVEGPAQPRASAEPDLAMALAGEPPAGYQSRDDGNRLGDTPARADDYSRLDAQLASETTGTPHINDVARRVRYNSAYFEIDVEVNRERGIVPVTWDMLRAHTPLVSQAYYARVYTSRGWVDGRQVPGFGPDVILPEAFTPELTPVIFEYFKRAFVDWNRNVNGWSEGMAEAWMKEAAIHVARVWTPQYVRGVAVASARASQITGQAALGAAAVPNAAAAVRACAGGSCLPVASRGGILRSAGNGRWISRGGLRYGADPNFGNRVRHVLNHAVDIPGRPGAHGVFDAGRNGALGVVDEAWAIAQRGGSGVSVSTRGARTVYTVDMGRRVGFVGGRAGAAAGNPAASHVRLVLEGNDVITAFPVIP